MKGVTPLDTLPTYVTPADVVARWLPVGTAPAENAPQLGVFIADLEDHAREKIEDFDDKATTGAIRSATMKRVISAAVIRVWKIAFDPRSTYSEATGPFSTSGTYGAGQGKGVTLTDDELEALRPRVADTSTKAAVIKRGEFSPVSSDYYLYDAHLYGSY